MTAHRFDGGCHCGNLRFVFEATVPLGTLGLRACMCSFCRAHGARNTSDPKGSIRIVVRDGGQFERYRFGLKTSDFLICKTCSVYIGAHLPHPGGGWFTVNVNAFDDRPPLDFPLEPHVFDAEDAASRVSRREDRWTPVVEFRLEKP